MKTKALKNTGKGMKMLCLALLLSVTFIWGYGIIVTDDALTGSMGVFTMLAGRFLLAAFLLFVLRACLFKTKQYARFTKKEIAAGALVGTLNFLGFFFQSVGLLYTDTAKSGMLTGGYVIVVPVVYCILRKKFQWRPLLNAVVFLVGMFFLFDLKGAGGNFNRGDAFTMLCAGFFAVQIILVDKFADGINVFNFNAVQMLTMGLLGLCGALAFERQSFASVEWSVCLPAVLYLGALSSAYAYLVQTFAQSRISRAVCQQIHAHGVRGKQRDLSLFIHADIHQILVVDAAVQSLCQRTIEGARRHRRTPCLRERKNKRSDEQKQCRKQKHRKQHAPHPLFSAHTRGIFPQLRLLHPIPPLRKGR